MRFAVKPEVKPKNRLELIAVTFICDRCQNANYSIIFEPNSGSHIALSTAIYKLFRLEANLLNTYFRRNCFATDVLSCLYLVCVEEWSKQCLFH